MSKNFGVMKANVGTNVMDTSTALGTIAGVYLNNRYFDILRRTNFETIVDPYNITVTAGIISMTWQRPLGKNSMYLIR